MACQHTQTAYAGLKKSLQQEWYLVHKVTPKIGEAFHLVDEALQKSFLPSLFQGDTEKAPTWGINCLKVNHAGMDIPNPTMSDWENWSDSCLITVNMVASLKGITEFNIGYHVLILREGRGEIQRRHGNNTQAALEEAMEATTTMEVC